MVFSTLQKRNELSLRSRLTKDEVINLLIELEHSRIIKFRTNVLGEIEIIPIGFNRETWNWLFFEKWGLTEKDIDIMQVIENAIHR